ncbi:MAG: hypothetical protein L3J68_03950 [Thermoplasmata archaeon]|jgi:hypothetical protein|nr:hypothetical protein [Thermoplasmata archaeon]
MHSYIDLFFTSDGVSPLEVSDRIRSLAGLSFIIGPHDVAFEWHTVDEFREKLGKVHAALHGTGVFYRIETVTDEPGFVEPVTWPPAALQSNTVHPGY